MIFFLPKLKFRKYPKPKGWGFCKSSLERERERESKPLLVHCCVFVGCVAAILLWALLHSHSEPLPCFVFCGLCCCVLVVGIATFFVAWSCCVSVLLIWICFRELES